MNIEELISSYETYILLGSCFLTLLLVLLVIIQGSRIRKLKKKYESFIQGSEGTSLEEMILNRFREVDQLKSSNEELTKRVETIGETLASAYQKIGVVKYDAFQEMGGKLSFAIALLNDKNDGVLVNSMHSSREGCFTYAKEIIHGESFVVLCEEEKQALEIALNQKNYME